MSEPRRFSRSQRLALYQAADGKCQICGKPLDANFHADHVQPYAADGATDVLNGQALCADCNLKKGTRMAENKIVLRKWQQAAYDKFFSDNKPDFFTVAWPGAGKSIYSLNIASTLLTDKRVRRLLVAVPFDSLKDYWTQEAAIFDIQLNRDWNFRRLVKGYDGVATTLAAIGRNPEQFRIYCAEEPTFVIIDEIHHLADDRTWGQGAREALEPALYRLALSGTPFRSDNDSIPFISYPNGECKWDFNYGYADGLRDGTLAPIYFPAYGGQIEWVSKYNGRVIAASFADELNQILTSERLSAALNLEGNWLRDTFGEADRKLSKLRKHGHPNAGGIVFAMSVPHAVGITEMIYKTTGEMPELVYGELLDATTRINKFKTSSARWIVSVKLISEGVDIKRLRVAIWATNVGTEMAFRQGVGRIVRPVPGLKDQSGYFFIPDDPTLVGYALKMKEERVQVLGEEDGNELPDDDEEKPTEPGGGGERKPLTVLDSYAEKSDIIFDAERFSLTEQAQYEELVANSGLADAGIEPIMAGVIIREWMKMNGQEGKPLAAGGAISVEARVSHSDERPLYERIKELRNDVTGKVQEYVRLKGVPYPERGAEIKHIHTTLKTLTGNYLDYADEEELNRKLDYVKSWIRGQEDANR